MAKSICELQITNLNSADPSHSFFNRGKGSWGEGGGGVASFLMGKASFLAGGGVPHEEHLFR